MFLAGRSVWCCGRSSRTATILILLCRWRVSTGHCVMDIRCRGRLMLMTICMHHDLLDTWQSLSLSLSLSILLSSVLTDASTPVRTRQWERDFTVYRLLATTQCLYTGLSYCLPACLSEGFYFNKFLILVNFLKRYVSWRLFCQWNFGGIFRRGKRSCWLLQNVGVINNWCITVNVNLCWQTAIQTDSLASRVNFLRRFIWESA